MVINGDDDDDGDDDGGDDHDDGKHASPRQKIHKF